MATTVSEKKSRNWLNRLLNNKGEISDEDNLLLVIATLIAAVTFQAGVNPPGGVWQDKGRNAGKAIYASHPVEFYIFLISNTIALCTSILVIISLIHRDFRFYLEMVTATVAMLVTYASAIFAVTPRDSVKFRYVLTAGALPFIVRLLTLLRKDTRNDKKKTPANQLGDRNGTDTA